MSVSLAASQTKESLSVPFIDLKQQFQNLKPELDKAMAPVFQDASFILGPAVKQFEANFAKYVGTKHCVSLHSGTAALHLALMAMGVGPGDEVITVANTFVATVEGIHFAGATAKLVEVDPVSYNMDVKELDKVATSKTKAIIPVHLYGQTAAMKELMAWADAKGIKVLEDSCQAHGAKHFGQNAGTFGVASCFSFYPGKNLGAAGEGGAVCTNDDEIAEQVRLLRDHGSRKKYVHEIVGHNFRLDSLQAAILDVKLPHLDKWNELRRKHAATYCQKLAGVEGLVLPVTAEGNEHVFHLFIVQVKDSQVRQKVQDYLNTKNVSTGIHYPVPVHLQAAFSNLGYQKGDFQISENLAERVLSLPMFPELTEAQIDHVVQSLKEALK